MSRALSLVSAVSKLKIGDPRNDPTVDLGPVINPAAADLLRELKAFQERKQEYEGYLKHLQESGESQLSLTDADSRLMKLHGDKKVCFNAQIAVDAKHHLIVADDVTNEVNDLEQLAAMAQAAKAALEVETLDAAADAGYHNGVEVVECEANGITPGPESGRNTAP